MADIHKTDIQHQSGKQDVDSELTRLLFNTGIRANVAAFFALGVLLFISWNLLSRSFLISWAFCTSVIIVYRIYLVLQFRKNKELSQRKIKAFKVTYLMTVAIVAACWATIVFVGLRLPEFEYRLFYLLCVVSLFGASVPVLAASIPAIYFYVFIPASVAIPMLFVQGGADSVIAVALMFYVFVVVKSGQNINATLVSSIRLQLKTQRLNSNLERMVTDRTLELEISRDRAEDANKAKSIFLAKMSHEIRTPMNAIINLSELALQEDMPARARDYVEKVHNSGVGLLGIINDILDLSKIESGKIIIENVAFSLKKLLSEIEASVFLQAKQKNLEFTIEIEPEIHDYYWGDPLRIRQILFNLVGNAFKFTDEGYVQVKISQRGEIGGDSLIEIVVKDTGIGMTSEEVAGVFKSFQQADNSITRKYGGTGLGLVICRQFAELMGGTIAVNSKKDNGSTFTVLLPLQKNDKQEAEHEITTSLDPSRYEKELESLGEVTILVVDDIPTNRLIVENVLENVGMKTVSANDGKEALQKMSEHKIDLVFMDVQMPEMDGYEATRRIRTSELWSKIPVIAMTANALPEDVNECYEAGMDSCVIKPIDVQELYKVIVENLYTENHPKSDEIN